MSSLPSLSQSIRPTPPLIDSTMYFLSGEEMCGTVSPAFAATSSNCGTADCVACGLEAAILANTKTLTNNSIHRASQIFLRNLCMESGDCRLYWPGDFRFCCLESSRILFWE